MSAFNNIIGHIDSRESFVLEAGAGSGKTYTLIQTLNYVLEKHGKELKYNNQKIICITYTNVAKNEIIERLEHNPLVLVSTIHEFLWDSIKSYQKQLKLELIRLNEIRYNDELVKLATLTGAELRNFSHKYIPELSERSSNIIKVEYQDTSFRDFENGLLHHDDVISISKIMFEKNTLLTTILVQKYPFIFIDEYQDTAEETVSALIDFLLERNKNKVVLGFYGDSYQKIYDTGVGSLMSYVDKNQIVLVNKEENYRSSAKVVGLLNAFRTNIEQVPIRQQEGSVKLIYCRNYPEKEIVINSKGKAVEESITQYEKRIEPNKNANYEVVINKLLSQEWNFQEKSSDKILVIANSRVAKRAKFGNLYSIFTERYGQRAKEYLIDREHPLIKFLAGYVDKKTSQERETGLEHLISFWNNKSYNEVYRFFKKYSKIFSDETLEHKHKIIINQKLEELIELRSSGTIKQVLDFVNNNNIINLTEGLLRFINRVETDTSTIEDEAIKERTVKDQKLFENLLALPYSEVISLFFHIQNFTVFSTKHSTKGEEYRNVLTVIDDTEWKAEYNFEKFFNDSDDKENRKLRTRNLFYVECSRAKANLVVLTLSPMDDIALNTLRSWFGPENVISIEALN